MSALALLVPALAAHAASRPTVVELYTSEGCSSCPPAELYWGELAARPNVLALSFHVDYWDALGWRDRWAARDFTARQRAYAQRLGLSAVFTPQAIVEGRDSYVGSDRNRIESRLRKASGGLPVLLKLDGGDLVMDIPSAPQAADILLLPFRRHVLSHIGRGENQGRTLEESNVVRQVLRVGQAGSAATELRVSRSALPEDATDVAVLVQSVNGGEIVGAARVALGSTSGEFR